MIASKAVNGIVTDPFNSFRWASYSDDGNVRIFDIRNPVEPIGSFNAEYRSGLGQLLWCPYRSGLLATIGKESPVVKVWELDKLQTSTFENTRRLESTEAHDEKSKVHKDGLPVVMNMRSSKTFLHSDAHLKYLILDFIASVDVSSNILSFAWDCSKLSRLDYSYRFLVLGSSNAVHHIKLPVAPVYCMAETGSLTLVNGIQARDMTQPALVSDISNVMRERVLLGYGFDVWKIFLLDYCNIQSF